MPKLALDENVLLWTIDHILKHGDTDIFPYPFEFEFLREKKLEIASALAQIDLQTYRPTNALESLLPKSKYGFRVAHQLHPVDTILLTGAVATIGSDLEAARLPAELKSAFSYRFEPNSDFDFFAGDHTYYEWLRHQFMRTSFTDEYTHIVKSDISDFYSRIYFHRIENCLQDYTNNSPFAKFILNFIKDLRAKQSIGIPVGGNASRLIAEVLLNDTDNALRNEGYDFTRYVDDFVIFIKRGQDPYSAMAFLAEHLSVNEILSLNTSKSKILTIDEFRQGLSISSGEDESQAERSATEELFWRAYGQESVDEDALLELASKDLAGELKEELDNEYWDIQKIRVLLMALRITKSRSSVGFVKDNLDRLMPFLKQTVLFIEELKKDGDNSFDEIGDQLIDLTLGPTARRLPVVRSWLLELFVRGVVPISAAQVQRLSSLDHTLDRRQYILLKMLVGDRNYFRMGKTRIDELSDWLKPAFIYGASCLPKDEYEKWVQAIHGRMTFPLSGLFCDWAVSRVA